MAPETDKRSQEPKPVAPAPPAAPRAPATPPPLSARLDALELRRVLQAIRLRLDKEPSYRDTLQKFVPLVSFQQVATANTHVIYGRNGTGKTHLLRAFHEYCERNYPRAKVLPVYIDCKDLELGPVATDISPPDLVTRFYRRFVMTIVDALESFTNKVITVSVLQQLLPGSDANRRRTGIRTELNRIRELLHKVDEQLETYKRELSTLGTLDRSASAEIAAGLDTSHPSAPRAKIGVGAKAGATNEQRDKRSLVFKGLSVIDYAKIRRSLEDIVDFAGASAVILLIDEWSYIQLAVQPLLAEMIKRTLSSSDRLFLKVASVRYFTNFSDSTESRQRIGLQTGIDIHQLVDLDDFYAVDLDRQGVKDFLTLLLFRHVSLDIPRLLEYDPAEFEQYLISEVFDGIESYVELIRASEGNPRDFLSLLDQCLSSQRPDLGKRISQRDVQSAASRYFSGSKAPEIQGNKAAMDLFESLYDRVVRERKQKLFLVSARLAQQDARIRELLNYRFIHLVEPSFDHVDANARVKTYAVYSMDYGRVVSLKLSREGAELVDELNRGLERVVRVLPAHSELSIALRSQLNRHLLTLDGESNDANQEGDVKAADPAEGWGVLVSSGCILDDLVAPGEVTTANRPQAGASTANLVEFGEVASQTRRRRGRKDAK